MHTTYHSSSVHISARPDFVSSYLFPHALRCFKSTVFTQRLLDTSSPPLFLSFNVSFFVIPFVLNNLVFHQNLLDFSASPHPPRTTLDRLRIRVTGADVLEYSRLVKAA